MKRQQGISLVAVALIMAALAGAAMLAMMSMRKERNLLSEGLDQARARAAEVSKPAAAPLRKCVIHGKTVLSDTECQDSGVVVKAQDTRGIEAPKAPPKPAPQPQEMRDQQIERATR